MAVQRSVRLRRWSLALGTSIVAMGMASAADAQCTPDPTVAGGTTTCTGTDNDGLSVATFNTRVVVAAGAAVRPGAAEAAIATRAQAATFLVNGTVDGGGKPGLLVTNGAPYLAPCDPYAGAAPIVCPPGLQTYYPPADATVTIAEGGTITGAQGLLSRRASGTNSGRITVTITNAGAITGTGGAAIRDASDLLTISNAASARIASVGTAIETDGALRLTNAGTIEGSVVSRAVAGQNSTIDTLAGTVRGDLTLGAGDDTLLARYDAGQVVTGITGAVNGGAGIDTLDLRLAGTADFAALPLLAGFERLALALSGDATVTLGTPGSVVNGLVTVRGRGTVTNRATLVGTGEVVGDGFADGSPVFVNAGTIRAAAAPSTSNGTGNTFAVRLSTVRRFQNDGAVEAAGNGVSFNAQGSFVNAGSITAVGTGVELFGSSFANTGTIRSTAGTGAILGGSSGANWTNAGTIQGTVAGVRLGSNLVNTGLVTSPALGVVLNAYGILDNRAGGRVVGGVGPQSATDTTFNAVVANAGTIDGNVRLSGRSFAGFSNGNRYFALPGGVLNGNLTLNSGELLVTDLVNTGTGTFAGIAGTVTATDALLRYRVRGDATATATAGARPGFAEIGYDLYDKAALTLTGATTPLVLGGDGSVDLTGDIVATTRPAITVTTAIAAPGETVTTGTSASGVTITSWGTLTLERAENSQSFVATAVSLDRGSSFVNAGTVVARDRATGFGQLAAISGGTVVNDGTITLDGATGISDAVRVTNTGAIAQGAGGRAARGLYSFGSLTLTNSGTIAVAGNAVTGGSGLTVDNSGRIASTAGYAIGTESYGFGTITNRAGGTIAGSGTAVRLSGGTLTNAGTILGSVDLGYSSFGRAFGNGTYVAAGGTIAGDLLFGDGSDQLVVYDGASGVGGRIDSGAGTDSYVHARTASGTVTLGAALPTGFEVEGVRAVGAATTVTVRADAGVAGGLEVSGDGGIVNTVAFGGAVTTPYRGFANDPTTQVPILAAFTNQARLDGGFSGSVRRFVNGATGVVAADNRIGSAVQIDQDVGIDFANDGRIDGNTGNVGASLRSATGVTAANGGTITGGLYLSAYDYTSGVTPVPTAITPESMALSLTNTGNIAGTGTGLSMNGFSNVGRDVTVTLDNRGTVEATGAGGTAAYLEAGRAGAEGTRLIVTNGGTIRANGGGEERQTTDFFGRPPTTYTAVATALNAATSGSVAVTNTATGTIEATGALSTGLLAGGTLDLANAGTIRGGGSYTANGFAQAGAIQTGDGDDRVVNTGTITGSVGLGDGNDRVGNYGRIDGDVALGAGDDVFLHRASAILTGMVDAGAGDDGLVIDATGGGTVRAAQFINFERLSQIGTGAVDYVGAFRFDTLGVSGGTVTVAAGETLGTAGTTTITGSSANEIVRNAGTITGDIALAGGSDRVDNAGTIGGAVLLGDGNDVFVERAGSRVSGGVDGGAGTDLYTVALTGDRTGIGARRGFEQLGVEGRGTLTLTLDQNFDTVTLAGTGLTLALNGYRVGAVTGSDAAETLAVDGDVAQVALGAGDDTLALGGTRAAGRYAGGAGSDTLRFTATAPVVLAGTATGFDQVALAGNALTVTGTLGAAGETTGFGAGDQQLVLADGGTLAGTIDLGAGNDAFRLTANDTLLGRVSGGAGDDTATLVLAGARTLAAGTLTDFETLASEGTGTLTLAGSHAYGRVLAGSDLTIAGGSDLATRELRFGAGDDRLTIAGGFAGAVDGGAGRDTIALSGGSAASPVAFSSIANVEALAQSGGFATISGNAALGTIDLAGGRLVGLAGSAIHADRIAVEQGATFGSAGIVTGNLAVAGILSPGASPGTMTVNGNVALATGSRTLFELTPTVSDRLVVNGALSIATGTTLEIVSTGTLRPGTSYDLITASGGITGGFTTVIKPAGLFGFVVQRADRILLLGQFLGDARFSPQVARSIAYANATLAVQPATSTLFAALPSLVDTLGASNARAFAQLTPEAYASATQLGVDHALALTQAARGSAFATTREDAGLFTFAQTVGQWHRLAGDRAKGSSDARSRSYGFLGGLGFGDRNWMVGAFAGYLDGRQQVGALGARTRADGAVAGIHGRYAGDAGWGFAASLLYDGGKARTDRALPGTPAVSGRYDLHGVVSDLSAWYGFAVAGGWTLRPHVGLTYARTTRDGVAENGSPFALQVARDRHVAGFVDTGIAFARSDASTAAFRPFVTLGTRYQIEGRHVDALAGYANGGLGFTAVGASRAHLVGTASAGGGYRLSTDLDFFTSASAQTGRDDHQETITTGVRLRF